MLARQQEKPAGVIDKDYALEWLLHGIYHKDSRIRDLMILKGGTSIRKIFFPQTWRFSEDLDFTIDFMRNRCRSWIITNKFVSSRSITHKV